MKRKGKMRRKRKRRKGGKKRETKRKEKKEEKKKRKTKKKKKKEKQKEKPIIMGTVFSVHDKYLQFVSGNQGTIMMRNTSLASCSMHEKHFKREKGNRKENGSCEWILAQKPEGTRQAGRMLVATCVSLHANI